MMDIVNNQFSFRESVYRFTEKGPSFSHATRLSAGVPPDAA